MNLETIKQTTWIGTDSLRGPIKGIVMTFHGLGSAGMKEGPSEVELEWGDRGGLVVHPYTGPWHWTTAPVRAYLDDLIGSVREHYCGGRDVPIILTGGSLGGHTALLYARYSKHKLAACLALCPVGSVKFSFSERPDVARTVLAAVEWRTNDLEKYFTELSPNEQVAHMQKIPYMIIHGAKDKAVAKAPHSDILVERMRARGLDVEYVEVANMDHGGPFTYELHRKRVEFVNRHLRE